MQTLWIVVTFAFVVAVLASAAGAGWRMFHPRH